MNKKEIHSATVPDCPIRNVISHITDKWSLLVLQKPIDLITVRSLEQKTDSAHDLHFREAVKKERMLIYVAA